MAERSARRKRWLPALIGRGRILGWIVWALLLLVVGVIVWLQVALPAGDQGFSNALSMGMVGLIVIIWLLWFLAGSGQAWWVRLTVPLGLFAGIWLFTTLFRFEAVSGNFVPRFALRSSEKADKLLEQPGGGSAAVDLLATTADDFPQFLGPGRNATIDHVRLARDWESSPPKLLWRQEIGAGWSGFAAVAGHALTLEQRGKNELVTCYDLDTGEVEWVHSTEERFDSTVAGIGPRSTPTIDGGVVYTQGATGRMLALDGATGAVLWQRDLRAEFGMTPEQEARDLPYGRSGSPLVVGDLLVVPAGGPSDGRTVSLVAYDKTTGDKIWEAGEDQISCASPTLATLGGAEQVLIVNESSASGHDPASGRLLWSYPREGKSNANANVSNAVPLPPDRVFLSKGYGLGAALIELSPNPDGSFAVTELWRNSRVMRTKLTNVAIRDGYVYGLSDGILECIDLETGKRAWKGGRYKHGQILLVDDLLLVLAESGELFLVEATPEKRNHVLGSFQAIEGKTWNTFALSGSRLLVRNGREAAAYELPLAG
ncbi:MAG: PQQ-binding-like beta-propeller repeat protein [Thermoanaerobaculia bacterium]